MLQIVGTYTKISINPEKTQKLKFMLFSSPDLVVRRSPGWSCHVAGRRYLVCKVDACNSIPTISMFDNGNILIIYTLVWHAK